MNSNFEWGEISKRYIDSNDVVNKFYEKDIFLFGAGRDGKQFLDQFAMKMNIVAVVDNGLFENGLKEINKIPIWDYIQLKQKRKKEPIIIASLDYAYDIQLQLEEQGYSLNTDFYIWNPKALEVNVHTKKIIEHNRKIWKINHLEKRKNRILLRHYKGHESIYVDWSYYANNLASKYEAQLWTWGWYYDFYDDGVNQIYQSFNVNRVLFIDLTHEQKEKVDRLTQQLWKVLKTKNDWLNITIDGYTFGEDIYACYIRGHLDDICEDLQDVRFRIYLKKMIMWIVFWLDYFDLYNDVKAIVLADGLYEDAIIRKIAIKHGIDVYGITVDLKRKWNNFVPGRLYWYYKKFFYELSDEEKKIGITWAKEKLKKRLLGDTSDIRYMKISAYGNSSNIQVSLPKNGKIKVMICPHCFNDDPYINGRFIFADHWEWLCYLGDLSNRTNYDWYLKVHPAANEIDWKLLTMLVERFPNIKILPHKVSAVQLYKEGISFALTVWGTIGHEYPLIGIQVINAGINPHIAFDFTWNPTNLAEYEDILLHLEERERKIDKNQIYQFYCIHYLFCKKMIDDRYDVCYKSSDLITKLRSLTGRANTQRYSDFLDEWNEERHQEIIKNVKESIEYLDGYRDENFNKNEWSDNL